MPISTWRKLAMLDNAIEQAAIILVNLDIVFVDLDSGAVVVLTDEWVRVRRLPIVS
jgi:hypothetical protein